jgi:putative tryptophan/tyrosine transport system substrate-binding protein
MSMNYARVVLIGVLAFGLLIAPLAAGAQQARKIARVGFLGVGPPPSQEQIAQSPFVLAMRERGWVAGQNLVIERRYGESTDQLHVFATELGRLKVDVLVVASAGLATIARLEAKDTPIVIMASGDDLVRIGLVASLARPGGNITGSQILQDDLFEKRLQLLKELVPNLSRVAFLDENVTRSEPLYSKERARRQQRDPAAARSLGLELHSYITTRSEDFPALFGDMIKKGDHGLIVEATPFNTVNRRQIIDLAARHRIPAVFTFRIWMEAGGLMSYGADPSSFAPRAASLVDKILKGAKAGDLPIEQSTKFELGINLKTAKVLGLTIPPALLLRADHVIE